MRHCTLGDSGSFQSSIASRASPFDLKRQKDVEHVPEHTSASNDRVEELIEFLTPFVESIIERLNVDEFTTVEFIDAMQMASEVRAAYEASIRLWHEDNPEMAKMVIHGQVIPQILRRSGKVVWSGYAHGEDDPYAVAAWWSRIAAG
jgi:hypothetical protein